MANIDLNSLTLRELMKLQKDVSRAVETYEIRRKQEARMALEAEARKMGFSLAELAEGTKAKGRALRPPKYRHPGNPSLTWCGQGRQPHWFKEALGSGRSREELFIDPES